MFKVCYTHIFERHFTWQKYINIYFQRNGDLSCSFYGSHTKSTSLFLKNELHVKFDPALVCFTPVRFLSRFEMTLLMGFWRREGAPSSWTFVSVPGRLIQPDSRCNGAVVSCFQSTISTVAASRRESALIKFLTKTLNMCCENKLCVANRYKNKYFARL